MSLEKYRKYVIIMLIIVLYFVPFMDSGAELSDDISGFSYEIEEFSRSGRISEHDGLTVDDYMLFTGFLKNPDNQAYIRKYTFAVILLFQLTVCYIICKRKNNRHAELKDRWQSIIDFIHEKDGTKGKRLLNL